MILTVDLHTHILPNIDDGAENLQEALEMLSIAVNNGTGGIVLTPHYLTRDMRASGKSKQEIIESFHNFKAAAKVEYPNLELYLGAEIFAVSNIDEIIKNDLLIPINGTQYVLLEFAFDDYASRAFGVAETLLQYNYTPIIAHPERYGFIQRDPHGIVKFLEKGMLLQIDASSLAGFNGPVAKDIAMSFIESNVAAIIASDCHSTYQRTPDLSEAYSFISSAFSVEYAEDIFYNNQHSILKGVRL